MFFLFLVTFVTCSATCTDDNIFSILIAITQDDDVIGLH